MPRHTTDIDLVEKIYAQMIRYEKLTKRDISEFLELSDWLENAKQMHRSEYSIAGRWFRRIMRKGKGKNGHR